MLYAREGGSARVDRSIAKGETVTRELVRRKPLHTSCFCIIKTVICQLRYITVISILKPPGLSPKLVLQVIDTALRIDIVSSVNSEYVLTPSNVRHSTRTILAVDNIKYKEVLAGGERNIESMLTLCN